MYFVAAMEIQSVCATNGLPAGGDWPEGETRDAYYSVYINRHRFLSIAELS